MAADDPSGIEFFESKIRPILVDNCYSCHSQQSPKIKGGLLLRRSRPQPFDQGGSIHRQ
jgi:hypothetical protein